MPDKHPVTVLIPVFNEADNLKELLPLVVSWAGEVLVVDSFSSDNTVQIAREYETKVLQREYVNSANQKNWAVPQAAYDWVFLIDADERPTEELASEVKKIVSNGHSENSPVAYWIGRDNYFLGKPVRYSGWQNDAVIRLFRRDKCRYENKEVHAEIIAEGKVSRLKGKFIHYTYKNISHFLAKMERYARWSANDYLPRTPKVTFFHLYFKPTYRFFKHFILKQGFRDGKTGFVVAKILAWGVFLRYLFIMEIHKESEK